MSTASYFEQDLKLKRISGQPSLGNFALFPYASCVNDTVDGCDFPKKSRKTQFSNSTLKASPGYFALTLNSGVQAEMTAAQHTSLFRFTFPSAESSPLVLLDLTDLSDSRQDNASVTVDADTGRMTGNGRFLPSFGTGNYVAYFCADFSGSDIRDNGIWVDSRGSAGVKDLKISRGINGGGPLPGGAFTRFVSSEPISVRVGLSFVSSDQACGNAEAEVPTFDFNATRSAAVSAWREKLSPITVATTGVNSSLLTNFYSGFYRTMVNPQNYTGVNPIVSGDKPWFDSFYWYEPRPWTWGRELLTCIFKHLGPLSFTATLPHSDRHSSGSSNALGSSEYLRVSRLAA